MDGKISVMIADDVEQTRTDIGRLLYFEEDMTVVAEAADGVQAIRLAGEHQPQVILMDINMPGMDGIEATEQISLNYPNTAVIIISIQGENEYLRKAMVAGARDYLVKPLSSEQLAQTIRTAASLNEKRYRDGGKPGRENLQVGEKHVRCFYAPVGGIGKSTLSVNTGVLLAQKKKTVALLDADLQFGTIALNLNLKPDRNWEDLVREEVGGEDLSTFLIPHFSGIKLLASPGRPQAEEIVSAEAVSHVIKGLTSFFDEIIVDLPTAFSDKTVEIIELATEIYLVVSPDLVAVQKVKTALEGFRALELSGKIKLLLNRADQPEALKKSAVEEVLGLPVWASLPFEPKLLLNSINRGIPFILNQGSAEISQALQDIFKGVQGNTPVKKRGVMGFFNL